MKRMNKGFTLIELIIVIAILGIIALIAIPNLAGIRQRSQVAADKRTAEQIGKAVRIWYTDEDAVKERVLPTLNNTDTAKGNIIVRLDKDSVAENAIFEGLKDYISIPEAPKSWGGSETEGAYYISTTGSSTDNGVSQKIVVGISAKNANISALTDKRATNSNSLFDELFDKVASEKVVTQIDNYDGSRAGWCYLEK